MGEKRVGSYSKARIRNLTQYRNLSDEEFDEMWDRKIIGIAQNSEFENRIQRKLDEFSGDYDIDDLKINDKISLRHLVQAIIALEDLEQINYSIRSKGFDPSKIIENRELSNQMSLLRSDISKIQTDLGITRKARKGDKDETVISELERLKQKAREFYEQRMFYIYCPKCNTLLSTAWFLYPDEKNNKIQLICAREKDDGNICGTKFTIGTKELLERRGFNSDNVPEGLK